MPNQALTFGVRDRPVAFIVHDPDLAGDAFALKESIKNKVTSVDLVESNALDTIRQASYDLAITLSPGPRLRIDAPLHVIRFGNGILELLTSKSGNSVVDVVRSQESHAREWQIPAALPAGVADLVRADLLKGVPRGSNEPEGYDGATAVTYVRHRSGPGARASWPSSSEFTPFLADPDRYAYAVEYVRRAVEGRRYFEWSLPFTADRAKWVEMFVSVMHLRDADAFPARVNWASTREFMSPDEVSTSDHIASIADRRSRAIAELDEEQALAERRLEAARARADSGPRRLISARGSDLVDAVKEALVRLGLSVLDSDGTAMPGDLLEDLQIRNPGHPDDVAISEVRSYSGGAQQKDLLRITGRFALRYTQKHGQAPSHMWYIVNHFNSKGPDARGVPLASNPDEVEGFAEVGGLVMGTPDLLRLTLAVERNLLTAREGRELLWLAKGDFSRALAEVASKWPH